MGQTPPPPPQRQRRAPPIVPFDLACDGHREAWSRYEAEREYETWQTGEDYAPTPTNALWLCNGKIAHVDGSLRKQPKRIPGPIPGDWK